MSCNRSELVCIAILEGREIVRVLPDPIPLDAAMKSLEVYNRLTHGTRQHAAVVYPIAAAICSASPRSRSA